MRHRIILITAALLMLTSPILAQAKKKPVPAPAAKPTLSEMAMKGQIDEAVSLAVKDPLAAEAALNTLMAAADTNIVNRKISDAMAALNAAQNFLDALEKTGQFKKLPREALMGRQLRVQGILLNDQKQYPKAVEVLRQALTISQRAQDPALDAGIHNNLGYALQYQGLVEDAIKEFEAARKIAEEQKDDLRAGSYNYNLGTALLDGSHSQEAQEAFKRSAAQNKVAGRTNLEARAIMMQGVAAGKMNPLAEDALKFFKDAEAIFEKIGDDRNAGWSYFLIADHIQNNLDYKRAAESAEKAVPFLAKAEDKNGLTLCYELLGKIFTNLNDKVKAENYKKLATELAAKK